MPTADINILAVLVAGLMSIALGMFWYAPKVFGTTWMRESGRTMTVSEKEKGKGMGWRYGLAFLAALVTAYVLSHFVDYIGAESAADGLQTGFWIWLGFIVPVQIGSVLWDNKSWKHFAITAGYSLVQLMIFGAMLVAWK